MGFKDRWAEQARAHDAQVRSRLVEMLAPATVAEHASLIPAAFERGGGGGNDFASRLLNKVVNSAMTKASAGRHIGGDEGSIARSLPQGSEQMLAALTGDGVVFLSVPHPAETHDFSPVYTIPARSIRAAQDTGQRAQGGVPFFRFVFTDDSFFDYRITHTDSGNAFMAACATRWPA